MTPGPRRSDRRNEFLRHPVVEALLAADPSTDSPRQAVRNRVAGVIAEARARGWDGPPFDMEVLASLRDIVVKTADGLSDDQDGCFIPGSPPMILVNPRTPRTRQRYTIAHEIVHTLLPDHRTGGSARPWTYRFDGQSPVEQLCQVGASELLMPTPELEDLLGGRPETLEVARAVVRVFDVSLEAAIRHLVDVSPRRCAMVVLRRMHKPSERRPAAQTSLPGFETPPPPKRLRIHYGWTSWGWDERFLPRFKSVPDDSVAYDAAEAAEDGAVRAATEDWSDVGGLGICTVEAVSMWSGSSEPSVLCLVAPAPAHPHTSDIHTKGGTVRHRRPRNA